ncbi:sodium/potassium/calcium exchanger 1-like [Neltuma alba]|uniref:sodium/potassium/calcium exchanger 1-like n=1 Tax=Neltuma alba TaxID=207710 RepID=UPI0010A529C0|nr:sodium/potassium/calcium exchanger 1-like [Prosopis alba]
MGSKNLSLLISHFDSIKARFANNFVPGNMLWAVTSLGVFICNCVLYSYGLILRFVSRVQKADGKNELSDQPEDSRIDEFRDELINFLFQSNEYVNADGEETEMGSSALMEALNEKESGDEGTVSSVSENTDSDNFEDSRSTGEEEEAEEEEEDIPASMNEEGEKESDANTKTNSEFYDGGVKNEEEVAERSVLMEGSSEVHENSMRRVEEKTESSVTMEDDFDHENSKKRGGGGGGGEDRDETRKSALMEGEEMERDEEDEETERPALITNKFEYVSGRGIIGFVEEPTTAMTFSFREFFVGPYVSDTEISELKSEKKNLPEHRVLENFILLQVALKWKFQTSNRSTNQFFKKKRREKFQSSNQRMKNLLENRGLENFIYPQMALK